MRSAKEISCTKNAARREPKLLCWKHGRKFCFSVVGHVDHLQWNWRRTLTCGWMWLLKWHLCGDRSVGIRQTHAVSLRLKTRQQRTIGVSGACRTMQMISTRLSVARSPRFWVSWLKGPEVPERQNKPDRAKGECQHYPCTLIPLQRCKTWQVQTTKLLNFHQRKKRKWLQKQLNLAKSGTCRADHSKQQVSFRDLQPSQEPSIWCVCALTWSSVL